MTFTTSTDSPESTTKLAHRLAVLLRGQEVIELISDLGGGKTTFVQGLAAGLGYTGPVTSPTFTLSQIYRLPDDREVHHYDLYRLSEAGVVGQELAEELDQPDNITVIEWGGVAEAVLPADRLRIAIEVTADTARDWTFTSSGPVSERLVGELQS